MTAPPRATPAKSRRLNAAGFTLLEVMVALTLMAFVVVLAFGGLRFGAKAWESGERTAGRLSELQVAHRVVTRILSRAYPLALLDRDEPRYAFEGTAEAVRFVAFMPHYPDVAGPYIVNLEIIQNKRGNELRFKRAPFNATTRTLQLEEETDEDAFLFETPHRMAFSYFEADEDGAGGRWLESWELNDEKVPALVRLRVFAQDDDGRVWPDLVARLAIDMDIACIASGAEGLCRLRK